MKFFQFNIGDWSAATRWLTPLERGVYLDLLLIYYETEKPLMRTQCERIQNAYADDARAAMQAVLQEFFVEQEDGSWRHETCDRVIADYAEKAEKARRSAEIRWKRNTDAMRTHSGRSAEAEQAQSEGNANHKPITNISNADALDNSGAALKPRRTVAEKTPFPFDSIPTEWDEYARELGFRADETAQHFAACRYYWTKGKGSNVQRTGKSWSTTWANWLEKAKKDRTAPSSIAYQRRETPEEHAERAYQETLRLIGISDQEDLPYDAK